MTNMLDVSYIGANAWVVRYSTLFEREEYSGDG